MSAWPIQTVPPGIGSSADAIHASAVVVGEGAVIVRGPSGAGKSALALGLLAAASARGTFAQLVGDDRLLLRRAGGRLVVAGHPAVAGLVERRFVGLSPVAAETEAVACLVVDLATSGSAPARLPDDVARETVILGVRLPRLHLPARFSGATEAVLHALGALDRADGGAPR